MGEVNNIIAIGNAQICSLILQAALAKWSAEEEIMKEGDGKSTQNPY